MAVVINGTTGVSGVDGSAGTPSYQGTDSNTGIFFPAADTIAFGEGGAEAMRIDSSGNVGIGTSSPGQKLDVRGSGNTYLRIEDTQANGYNAATLYKNDQRQFRVGVLGTAGGFTNGALVVYDETAADWRMVIDSSGNFQFNSGYGSVATAYGCRAWVNFDGSGTVAIRASKNVSSITDNATGDYTINFTTAMPDANYVVCGSAGYTPNQGAVFNKSDLSAQSTSAVRIIAIIPNVALYDSTQIHAAIFR